MLDGLRRPGASESKSIRCLLSENEGKIRSFVFRNGGSQEDFEEVLQQGVTATVLNIRAKKI